MKAFELDPAQTTRIVGGLIAEEMSWRFKRHVDFLTLAGWTEATPLGAQGAGLAAAEHDDCLDRVARFFGFEKSLFRGATLRTIGDVADIAGKAASGSMRTLSFTPAGRDSRTEGCPHRADAVFRDAAATANLLYGRRRLITLIAPHSYFGLVVTALAPKLLQIPTVDARGMAPDELQQTMMFGDGVVATPSLWRYMVREGITAPDNAMGVFFGEAMAQELAAEMRKAGFGALREIYGSTETGLVGWRDSPSDEFVMFDHWRRDGELLIRTEPDGESRELTPMDVLEWSGGAGFRLGGRRDGAVQVGAVNVFPARIAATIRNHHAVDDCVIQIPKRVDGAPRLVARIILNPEYPPSEATARSIDSWCRLHLRPPERPRIYNFEASLEDDEKNPP